MFDAPILDVAIGLVFVFLLYSLLATSIKEAIASAFNLRARMLRVGIVERMLADSLSHGRWKSILHGIVNFFVAIWHMFIYKPDKKEHTKKIGDYFYEHPIMKNYGASKIFPHPSYLPADNFSQILIDILKSDFDKRIADIAAIKLSNSPSNQPLAIIQQDLANSSDIVKIKELLDFYTTNYNADANTGFVNGIIGKETCKILQMHLSASVYNLDNFSKRLEDWFEDMMNRVSGWYKRQAQIILFLIGIFLAISLNIDTIQITEKLSQDKNASEQVVKMAIASVDNYKNDPSLDTNKQIAMANLDSLKREYQAKSEDLSHILALGWNDYGRTNISFINELKEKNWYIPVFDIGNLFLQKVSLRNEYETVFKTEVAKFIKDSASFMETIDSSLLRKGIPNSTRNSIKVSKYYEKQEALANVMFYKRMASDNPIRLKTAYILFELRNNKKSWVGFLITAMAISLGAPFWFDLLNKLVNIRGAGKKEGDNSSNSQKSSDSAGSTDNTTVNINTSSSGVEAVG